MVKSKIDPRQFFGDCWDLINYVVKDSGGEITKIERFDKMKPETKSMIDTFIDHNLPKANTRPGVEKTYERGKQFISGMNLPATEYEDSIKYLTNKIKY